MTEKTIDELLAGKTIRLAVPGDEDQIYALLMMMHAEHGLFRVSPNKVREAIYSALFREHNRSGELGMIAVIEEDDKIVATIGLFITKAGWYSDDDVISERWMFVHPDHRRSDYAKRLVAFAKAAQAWFVDAGQTMPVVFGVFSTVRTEAKVRLYRRMAPQCGAMFIYGNTPRQPDNGASTTIIPTAHHKAASPASDKGMRRH